MPIQEPIALLGSTSRVEVPIISVKIGDYTFGVQMKMNNTRGTDKNGFYNPIVDKFPRYVKSLTVNKINGQVNTYSLVMEYPVTPDDDPNFIERVFSSVSKTRKMVITYGDISLPDYIYKEEETLITDVKTQFSIQSSVITYTISAVSSAQLGFIGYHTFVKRTAKPSDVIKELLKSDTYHLCELFYGMNNLTDDQTKALIPGNDGVVEIRARENISVMDYLLYLVTLMRPQASGNSLKQKTFYVLTIIDDVKEEYGGPYFKITPNSKDLQLQQAYTLDIGYPTGNIVTRFSIDNDENYSIFFDWNEQKGNGNYAGRINDNGELVNVYAPSISSDNSLHITRPEEQTWWSKVTEYPINIQIEFKGLIRPAILMTHLNLNVWFFGKRSIHSGTYVITKQTDTINEQGYRTVINAVRIAGAQDVN